MFAYFMGRPQDECPYMDIPLHTVFKLTAYGPEEQVFPLEVELTYENRTPDSGHEGGQ